MRGSILELRKLLGKDPPERYHAISGIRVDVVLTADLPSAGASVDGLILIEDAGAGDVNLIIYARGERHRIDGGADV